MIIFRMRVRNLGAIVALEAEFTSGVNVICGRASSELAGLLSFILCNHGTGGIPKQWVRVDSSVTGEVCLFGENCSLSTVVERGGLRIYVRDPKGKDVTAMYRDVLSHCTVDPLIESFDGQDRTIFRRLRDYRYGVARGMMFETGTKAFRKYLLNYIKDFSADILNSRKGYEMGMKVNGEFVALYPDECGRIYLSETEERIFRFLCFLNVAEFWEGYGKLRDLHYENKPLLIRNFVEYLDGSMDIKELLARAERQGRQMFLLTDSPSEALCHGVLREVVFYQSC